MWEQPATDSLNSDSSDEEVPSPKRKRKVVVSEGVKIAAVACIAQTMPQPTHASTHFSTR